MSPVPLESLRQGNLTPAPREGSNPARTLAFLKDHPAEAWRAHELAAALDLDQHTLGAALRRLRERGLIDKDGVYWFALDERESARAQAATALTRDANARLGRERPDDWASVEHE